MYNLHTMYYVDAMTKSGLETSLWKSSISRSLATRAWKTMPIKGNMDQVGHRATHSWRGARDVAPRVAQRVPPGLGRGPRRLTLDPSNHVSIVQNLVPSLDTTSLLFVLRYHEVDATDTTKPQKPAHVSNYHVP
jgi:hypothetical protein